MTPVFVSADLKPAKVGPGFASSSGRQKSSVVLLQFFLCCAFHWRDAAALAPHRISRRLLDSTCRSSPRSLPPDRLPLSGGGGRRCAHLYYCVYLATVHPAGRDRGR